MCLISMPQMVTCYYFTCVQYYTSIKEQNEHKKSLHDGMFSVAETATGYV